MKKGDKVFVNWPTGKGGPYETLAENNHGVRIKAYSGGDQSDYISVPRDWCEPVEPEIEEGRLVYAIRKQGIVGTLHEQSNGYHMVKIGKKIVPVRGKPSFVHRRWDELSIEERKYFANSFGLENQIKSIYREAYKLITGEEHP